MTKELQDKLDAASIVVADGKGGFYAMLHKSDVEEIVESIAPDNSELLAKDEMYKFAEWISEQRYKFCRTHLDDGKIKEWNKWYSDVNFVYQIGVTKWETTQEVFEQFQNAQFK